MNPLKIIKPSLLCSALLCNGIESTSGVESQNRRWNIDGTTLSANHTRRVGETRDPSHCVP
jgi:hypothetical protein